MKHTLIRVYEHESQKIGEKGFTENHFDLLARYLGDSEGEDFPYYSLIHRGIRMKQYVGVLKVGDVQIEGLQIESSPCCKIPKTNRDFWVRKIVRNKERDVEVQQKLAKMGWHSITIWECELKGAQRERTLESLAYTLHHIYLQDRKRPVRSYEQEDTDLGIAMAAEDE